MNANLEMALAIGLLLAVFGGVDAVLQLTKAIISRRTTAELRTFTWSSSVVCFALASFFTWGETRIETRALCCFLATILAWNAATRDLCPVAKSPRWDARVLVPLAALGSYFSPSLALLSVALLIVVFDTSEHHATFPMRLLLLVVAFSLLDPSIKYLGSLAQLPLQRSLLTLLLIVQISHYFISALAKARLGPHWYSWMLNNQLHLLSASAYSWGWARFLPWSSWHRVVAVVKRFEQPLQVAAFLLELLSPLALLDPQLAVGFCVAMALFHLGVFGLSGLLFWDWILADLALALTIGLHPAASEALGPASVLIGLCVLFVFPLRHKLWRPMPLGWFDSPLTARIHWFATGKSGAVYEIYNDFMCPYERLYGRVHGYFVSPKALLTYHLGEVFLPDLAQELIEAGPNEVRLDQLRTRFGVEANDAQLLHEHQLFLQAFFAELNQGSRKRVLPDWLAWLKAPGDQIYYFGQQPAYRRQEQIERVTLRFVEQYFDGHNLITLNDQSVAEITIPSLAPAHATVEPSPQALDRRLLKLANGRLIHLPARFLADPAPSHSSTI